MIKLELRDITFSYKSYNSTQKNRVLYNNLSLKAKESEKVLILGEAEKGKTTLASIITRITPRFKSGELAGKILINENDVTEIEPFETTREISLVPQNSAEFIINSKVEEEIVFPMEFRNLSVEEMKINLKASSALWDLDQLLDSDVSELSGGEKKRLNLAVNSAQDSQIVIYDESFDDLDINHKNTLKKLIKESRKTQIVFASRYIPEYESLFDSIYYLDEGILKVVNERDAKNIFSADRLNFEKSRKPLNYSLSADNLQSRRVKNNKSRQEFLLDVNHFHINKGEIVTLEGLNGSGKTTFSYILTGLRKQDSGYIMLNNKSVSSTELLLNVGYMFQNPDFQLFLPTVKDELMYSLDKTTLAKDEKESEVEKLCKMFDLISDENSLMMSFGKRKLLQSAIYYGLNRPFYILDELDSAISYEDSIKIINLLRERGAGILLITHDADFAKLVRNRGYRMERGVLYEN